MIKLFTYIQCVILAISVIVFFVSTDWIIRLSIIASDIALLTNLFRTYKIVKYLGTICSLSIIIYLLFFI